MIINVNPKGEINSGSFMSRLQVIRLDVHQIKLPAIQYHTHLREYRIHSEEMEMMVALTGTSNHPKQFEVRAVK